MLLLYKTEDELMYKAKQAEGKTFGEIDTTGRVKNEKAKGHLGQVIEESFFGYEVNSEKEADFDNLSIELKVTPIKKNKNGTLSAKERLVLNIINYHEEVHKEFKTSSFWKKNEKLLLMFYLWDPSLKRADYKLIKSYLYTYPEEDLAIIEQDWKAIINKIRQGQAHKLSEADTNYLAASTKGASKKSQRTQPFSDEMAMQRAFSLKQSYMTAIVRKIIQNEDLEQITNPKDLQKKSLSEILESKFYPYKDMSLEEISKKANLKINSQSKSFLQQFVSGLLGIQGTKLNQIDEFAKANIQFKTVRLELNGIPKEHMSFKNIDFLQWAKEDWNDSWLKNFFEETKLLFIVFHYKERKQDNPNRKLYFSGIKLWNMPKKLIDEQLKDFWIHVKSLINKGIKLTPIQQKNRVIVKNNLPKPGFNNICHIRPKARDGSDKKPLPDGRKITKQAFWLDREYVAKVCNHSNL